LGTVMVCDWLILKVKSLSICLHPAKKRATQAKKTKAILFIKK
jgi:aromatic ring-cleaving dioxygenase